MDDIKRQDRQLLIREVFQPWRLITGLGAFFIIISAMHDSGPGMLIPLMVVGFAYAMVCRNGVENKKFTNKRLEALWGGCKDRHKRFEEVLKKMSREQVADLQEMPATIHKVAINLYAALRRADVILSEVQGSEKGLYNQPPSWTAAPDDPQSQELYKLADRNIAEYRAQFAGVLAGVQRTEAQSAVFMTTLDSLRMKMLGYRLVGRSPEMNSGEFLSALAEARAQLQSIDHALEELDLGHYPTTIATSPPPVPAGAVDEAIERLRQGQ